MQTVLFAGYSCLPFARLFIPGFVSESTETVEKEYTTHQKHSIITWKSSKTKHWIKIIDGETDEIVGYVNILFLNEFQI